MKLKTRCKCNHEDPYAVQEVAGAIEENMQLMAQLNGLCGYTLVQAVAFWLGRVSVVSPANTPEEVRTVLIEQFDLGAKYETLHKEMAAEKKQQ